MAKAKSKDPEQEGKPKRGKKDIAEKGKDEVDERPKCSECNKPFTPRNGDQKTCGERACKDSRRNRKAKRQRDIERKERLGAKAGQEEDDEEFDPEKFAEEADLIAQKKKDIQRKADDKAFKNWLAGESREELLMDKFIDATQAYPPREKYNLWKPSKAKVKHDVEHAVFIMADPHFGELVRSEDTGGLGSTNLDVLADRVRYAFWKAADMLQNLVRPQGIPINHLHVILMGDNVTGEFIYGSQPFHIDVPLEHQAIIGSDIVSRGIMSLADYFDKTTVVGIRGNHGEHRQGGRKTKSRTNFDGLFYDSLQQRMSLQDDITVVIPKAPWYIHYVNQYGFLLVHKNKGQSSLGTPYYAMDRDEKAMRSLLMNTGQSFFYYVVAHWHHYEQAELPYGERIVCPSIVGTTLFAAEDLRAASLPAVLFFGISAKYGQTWGYKIRLDQEVIPENMQLGAELDWECCVCGKGGYGIPDAYRGGKVVCVECAEAQDVG